MYQSKNDYSILIDDLNKIKADMGDAKKNIGQLLSNITAKGKWANWYLDWITLWREGGGVLIYF